MKRTPVEAEGLVDQLRAANADLDAQRRAAEDDRARLRLAIAAADLFTWDLDPATGQIVYSPNVAAVVGFPLPTTTAGVFRLLHPDDRDELAARIDQAVREDAPFAMEYRYLHPQSGEVVWLRAQGHLVGGDGAPGTRPRLIGVTQNVTQQKRRERDAAFLAGIQEDFTRLTDADAILRAAGARIARHFGFSRLTFAEIDAAGTEATVVYHQRAEPDQQDQPDTDVRTATGLHRVADLLGERAVGELSAGRIVTVDDVRAEPGATAGGGPFAPAGRGAAIFVPYLSENRWRFVLAGHRPQPHRWRDDEVASLRDLTARLYQRRARADAEARRRKDEERYRTLFESIDQGFCVIEVLFAADGGAVDYRFVEVNPAFERQTGLHAATGKLARELVPDLEPYWFEIYGRVAVTGEPVRFVNEAAAMDGRWFDVNAFRLGGPESRTVAILFADITARKRVEADIERLAAIVESSHDAIIRCQLDGTVVDWNRGAEELYGYTAAEIVGRDVAVLAPRDRVQEQVGFRHRLQRGEDIPPLETVRRRKDGTLVEVEVRPSAVRDAKGQIVGIGVIARDVSARKRLERAQEDFLAMASHDLRSPVTVLRGRAQLMRRRKKYDEAAVDAILEQARRIERLVSDLQEVVRLEAGAVDLRRTPTDLGQVARDAVERIQPQARSHRIRVVVSDVPVVGRWDPDRLGQVLDNLLGNAVKYAPAGGEVLVRVAAPDGEAHLSVTDHGPGIAAEALPKLFERFYRADDTGAASGLGLGLYIARMLVEAHGGRIAAESTPGEGSTFTVVLPIGL